MKKKQRRSGPRRVPSSKSESPERFWTPPPAPASITSKAVSSPSAVIPSTSGRRASQEAHHRPIPAHRHRHHRSARRRSMIDLKAERVQEEATVRPRRRNRPQGRTRPGGGLSAIPIPQPSPNCSPSGARRKSSASPAPGGEPALLSAIDQAEAEATSYLLGRYRAALPVEPPSTPPILKSKVAVLAHRKLLAGGQPSPTLETESQQPSPGSATSPEEPPASTSPSSPPVDNTAPTIAATMPTMPRPAPPRPGVLVMTSAHQLLVSPLPAGEWEGEGRGAGGEGAFRAATKGPAHTYSP